MNPPRPEDDAKGADERSREEALARSAVRQALRHAGVRAKLLECRAQREPFDPRGQRAERFAPGTRFRKERLWHVELELAVPVRGPLILGDGRFLGLGLMAPVHAQPSVFVYRVVGGWAEGEPSVVTRALRRAVMARFQTRIGDRALPAFVSGHDANDQGPTAAPHLLFVAEPDRQRLLIIPPHVTEHRAPRRAERQHIATLEEALEGFARLDAGDAGRLRLERDAFAGFPAASRWRTLTPYVVERHRRCGDASKAAQIDLESACRAAGLPAVDVDIARVRALRGRGLLAEATLRFERAVVGPIALGRTRFQGGGWFVPEVDASG